MSPIEDVRAVLLLRVRTSKDDIFRALAEMEGVYRVERIQGPYDIVVHVAGRKHVEAIEKHADVTAAEICWASPPDVIASDAHATGGRLMQCGARYRPGGNDPPGRVRDRTHESIEGFQ